MTQNEELDALVEKFNTLTMEISTKKPGRPRADGELKSILKEISKLDLDGDPKIGQKISPVINLIIHPRLTNDTTDTEISNAIGYLKALAETPLLKHQEKSEEPPQTRKDPFWLEVVLPKLPEIYKFFHSVLLTHCTKTLSATASKSTSECASSTGGFAHHHLLGLLQKGMRTLLIFLKRGVLNPETWKCNSEVGNSLQEIGNVLCDLMDHSVDIGLDIRCNIGIALSYIVFHKFKGDKFTIINFFEQIFVEVGTKNSSNEDVLLKRILNLSVKDINRIGMALGVVGSMDFEDVTVDYSKLMCMIGKNILDIDHGTKEATNLGSARMLEMWAENLSHPFVPLTTLEKIKSLFPYLEFFVFSYIPGHIDAVKNCCRNLLGSLTLIYDRLDSVKSGGTDGLIEELIRKLLSKPSHVKWMGLACVTKNSAASVKVLELHQDLPLALLCAQRTLKTPANESYIYLMSYEFSTVTPTIWEERWIVPLFSTQTSQDKESNWPQKKAIISTILKSEKSCSHLQILIAPILVFVIKKMNSNSEPQNKIQHTIDECEGFTESALLAVGTIKIASELGLKIELFEKFGKNCSAENSFRGLVPRSVLHSWLWSENPQIRLAGFSLLLETRKTSEMISKEDFKSFKILFKYSLVSQNPAFRQQFVAYVKKLLRRLKDSQSLLKRQRDEENLKNYDEFYHWIWNFLTTDEGLFAGANFARRCQSLDCLAEIVAYHEDLSIFGVKSLESNMDYLRWLTDSYENNKIRVLAILEKVPLPSFEVSLVGNDETCEAIFNEAISLCESLRPPDSVTGRYLMVLLMKKSLLYEKEKYSAWNILQSLLRKLEETYKRIERTTLTEVSCQSPMYGVIKCIHMIFSASDDYLKNSEKYRELSSKLIELFLKLDDILFPILGNSAPEGFLEGLPDSSEDNTQVVRSMTAQMLLVCSWRSMRDISLLLADMCILFPLEGENMNMRRNPEASMSKILHLKLSSSHVLTVEQILAIGDHLLYLLKNLMHRGVFEQVFVGFKILATRLWMSANPELNSLPEKWLKEAMNEEHMSSKCITRRSGGLPFIFQALLSAESDNEAFLAKWVQRLFIKDESPENSSLRIHAMNVLRGLIRDTNFSGAMMPFVPDGLRIAFRGLKSQNWNERNAGLMLYGAVMKRTFGPKLNLMSAPTFFRKFPQMYDFLLGELDTCLIKLKTRGPIKCVGDRDDPNLNPFDFTFHLLLLLSAFAPVGRVEDEHFRLGEFISRLQTCAGSPDMEVRKLAAKAIVPFLINPEDKKRFVLNMLNCLKDHMATEDISLNLLHGYLIQLAAVLGHISEDSTLTGFIPTFVEIFSTCGFWNIKCPSIYQAISQLLLGINKFKNPQIVKICKNLDIAYETLFDSRIIAYRNCVPGLPVADEYVSKLKIVCTLNFYESNLQLSEVIYGWFSAQQTNIIFVEQLLDHLCQNSSLVDNLFNTKDFETEGAVLLDSVVKRYMLEDIKYIGQSVLESKFLLLLTMVSDKTYNTWLKNSETDESLVSRLLERMILLCVGNSATTEHKALALRTFANMLFATEVPTSLDQQEILCKTLVDWSYSTVDDDLRYAVALSVPQIPFQKLEKFSVMNQCRIWLAIILLAQDDEPPVRSVINTKLSKTEKASCDRKSLETLIEIYFKEVVEPLPLEGLTLLVGLLFRDDFEIKTEDADDDEEGRLFDKSELNMFNEPVIFAKTVHRYMKINCPDKSYKSYFDRCLSIELVDLYELASNSKLFFCNCTLQFIIDILKKKEEADDIDEEMTGVKQNIFCLPSVSDKNGVQNFIRKTVEDAFV